MTRIITLLLVLVPILVKAQWSTSGSNIYNTNTGNVGIGFTSPDRKLYVRGIYSTTNAVSAFELQNSSGTESVAASFYAYPASTTGNTYLQNTFMMYLGGTTGLHMNFANPKTNGAIRFHTAGFDSQATERMVIHFNGNIGIGLSSPTKKLDVNGIIGINGVSVINTANSQNDIYINSRVIRNESTTLQDGMYLNYNSNGGAGAHLRFYANGTTERMQISAATGNVGINTAPHATYRLDVNGPINATALLVNGAPFTGGGGVQSYFDITPGTGNGLRFWNDNAYKIHMGNTAEYLYGPVTDYSIKMNMSSDVGRGWTWGISGSAPVAALSNTGKMKIAGGFEAVGPVTGTGPTILASGGGDVVLNSGGSVFFDGNYNYAAGNYIRPVAANTQAFFTSGAERMRITAAGTIGIGTTAPNASYKLDVSGVINASAIHINGVPFAGGGSQWTTNSSNIYFGTGNVGIGTIAPDAKLAVKGTVHAQEVKVDLAVPGPDYVFNDDYKLPSLEEVKAYIDKNKHLPEIPSAKEMEANGVNLGEMNMLLLKKIEELTLHMLQKEDEIKSLKSDVELLKKLIHEN